MRVNMRKRLDSCTLPLWNLRTTRLSPKTLKESLLSWNAGARRIFGYTEAEVLGQPVAILIPSELEDEENKFLQRLKSGEGTRIMKPSGWRKTGGELMSR